MRQPQTSLPQPIVCWLHWACSNAVTACQAGISAAQEQCARGSENVQACIVQQEARCRQIVAKGARQQCAPPRCCCSPGHDPGGRAATVGAAASASSAQHIPAGVRHEIAAGADSGMQVSSCAAAAVLYCQQCITEARVLQCRVSAETGSAAVAATSAQHAQHATAGQTLFTRMGNDQGKSPCKAKGQVAASRTQRVQAVCCRHACCCCCCCWKACLG